MVVIQSYLKTYDEKKKAVLAFLMSDKYDQGLVLYGKEKSSKTFLLNDAEVVQQCKRKNILILDSPSYAMKNRKFICGTSKLHPLMCHFTVFEFAPF